MKWLSSVFLSMFGMVAHTDIQLDKIKLPPDFTIEVFASDIEGARSMAWGNEGTLFVGTRDPGRVYAIDARGKKHILATGLNMPNGVAFRDGTLYIAEIHRIVKMENVESQLDSPPPIQEIVKYPEDSAHGWKFIAFGPDSLLYVPQGAPCNICQTKDIYGTITTVSQSGINRKVFASGIRNSVGFDWHPVTHELWFTDNGRDRMGDDIPPDELNKAPRAGMNFGYPHCHAGDILDPEFGAGKRCSDYTPPVQKLGPHVAALGMRFYTGGLFPKDYRNQIFIAEHGSWNRTKPLGYRVMMVRLDENGNSKGYEVFAEGWLQGDKPWGRPVDVINAPDGSILISDDMAGAIYKIRYKL